MIVIPPLPITDARLTSSSVVEVASAPYNAGTTYALNATASVAGTLGLITEYRSLQAGNVGHAPASSPTWWAKVCDTYQVYSAGATYALGERVIDTTKHLVYESLTAGNVGNALTDSTKWLLISATNKYAMFDMTRNTATIAPGSLTNVLTPGQRIDSIALLGMVANSVSISVSSGGSVVYTSTADLNAREVFDAYDYCFKPFSTKPAIIRLNVPPYTDAVITITLAATEGDVQIKYCVIGSAEYLGDVQYNARPGAKNYSTVERRFDGSVSAMIQRRRIPTTSQTLALDKSRVNAVRKVINALDATPAVWAGLDDDSDGYFDSLLICGFFTDFEFDLDAPTGALLSLTLEEI